MNNPIASILIPTFNSEKFINATLDSVIDQNLNKESYEIIIVDDGSKDSTVEILRNYQKKFKNLKVFTQENKGPAAALNKALEEAKGEFLFLMSHDCIAKDYWIKEVVKEFKKDDKIGIVQGQLLPTHPIDIPIFHCNNFTSFQVTFDTAEVAYRAVAVDNAGRYFREDFSTNGHDADMGWRIIEAGYTSKWLNKVLMYHDVLPRGFWKDLKSYYLMQYFPKLLKIHPGMRNFLKFQFIWSSILKYFFVIGLVTIVVFFLSRNFTVAFGSIIFVLGVSLIRVIRLTKEYKISTWKKLLIVFPHRLLSEIFLGYYLIYGSIKYKSLVI